MPTAPDDSRWGVLGYSQVGCTHTRAGLPNQDAFSSYILPDGSPPIVLAVADGHGSDKSFRSDVGSTIAVDVALRVCREFIDDFTTGTQIVRGDDSASALPTTASLASSIKNNAERQIPKKIVGSWQKQVQLHLVQNPITQEELDRLGKRAGQKERDRAESGKYPYYPYGSTLLVALLTNEFIIFFQLGDGDILTVTDGGDLYFPMPQDCELIANETTSLCQDDAAKYFRFHFQYFGTNDLRSRKLDLVLLSTDGYRNSFKTPAGFNQVGIDYWKMFGTDGVDSIQRDLPQWLEEVSREGSGDDVTIGMIYRRSLPLSTAKVVETATKKKPEQVNTGEIPGVGASLPLISVAPNSQEGQELQSHPLPPNPTPQQIEPPRDPPGPPEQLSSRNPSSPSDTPQAVAQNPPMQTVAESTSSEPCDAVPPVKKDALHRILDFFLPTFPASE